jgi:hypothetical protein
LVRSAVGVLGYKVKRQYQWWRGTATVDDSNARDAVAKMLAQKLPAVDAVPPVRDGDSAH